MTWSRRDVWKLMLAGTPVSLALGELDSTVHGVRIGIQTYSFRELWTHPAVALEEMIAAIHDLGVGECEIFEPELRPASINVDAPWAVTSKGKPSQSALDRKPPTGQQPTAAKVPHREEIREWRLTTPLDQFRSVRKKFNDAGVRIFALYFSLMDDCTDSEVDRAFEITKALGANIMTASPTLSMAKRTVPFAEKHKIIVGMHGHSNVSDPNEFARPESFAKALAMSKYYRINLDVGHFSACGYDPVAFIRANHDRITNIHLKDRKNNDGPYTPFGMGDTPIKEILQLLRAERYPIPVFIEYQYDGPGNPTDEVRKCIRYIQSALE